MKKFEYDILFVNGVRAPRFLLFGFLRGHPCC